MKKQKIDVLSNSACNRGIKASNSASFSAATTSCGAMVFLPADCVFSFALPEQKERKRVSEKANAKGTTHGSRAKWQMEAKKNYTYLDAM